MTAVFGHDFILDGENAVGQANGGKPVRDDEDGAALDNLPHVPMDYAFGLCNRGRKWLRRR